MAKNTVAPGQGFVPGSTNSRAVRHDPAKRGAAREPAAASDAPPAAADLKAETGEPASTSGDTAAAADTKKKPAAPRKRKVGKHKS